MRWPAHPYLNHPKVWWLVGALLWLGTLSMWFNDRAPPTTFEGQLVTPTIQAGGQGDIVMSVKRNLSRQCSLRYTRTLVNSNHASDILASGFITRQGLADREHDRPGVMTQTLHIPLQTPPGEAQLDNQLSYTCLWNPTTWILPIEGEWQAKVFITPAKTGVLFPNP